MSRLRPPSCKQVPKTCTSPYELFVPSKLDPVMHYSLAIQLLFISPTSNVTEAILIMYVALGRFSKRCHKTSIILEVFRSFYELPFQGLSYFLASCSTIFLFSTTNENWRAANHETPAGHMKPKVLSAKAHDTTGRF